MHLYSCIPFLAASQNWSPARAVLIGVVAILWLICFSSLFSRDRRMAKLRSLKRKKQTMGYTEKRSHARVSYPIFVLYRVIGASSGTQAMMASNARNLSESGILLEVKQDLPIGARLELKLKVGEKTPALFLQGIVCRKEPRSSAGNYDIGVGLDITRPQDREKLEEFLRLERSREETL